MYVNGGICVSDVLWEGLNEDIPLKLVLGCIRMHVSLNNWINFMYDIIRWENAGKHQECIHLDTCGGVSSHWTQIQYFRGRGVWFLMYDYIKGGTSTCLCILQWIDKTTSYSVMTQLLIIVTILEDPCLPSLQYNTELPKRHTQVLTCCPPQSLSWR